MERNEKQFWALLQGEYAQALLFCRKLMKNSDDGDDLYQEAILVAHKSFSKLREIEAFKAWLYRVIINTFKSNLRKPWFKRRVTKTEEELETHRANDPSSEYKAKRQVEQALSALSATDQALVTLFEIEGWTIKELAELRQTTQGSIKVKLHRARTKMREALEQRQKQQKHSASAKKISENTPNSERSQHALL